MSTRSEVLLWAQRVIARKGQPAHILLELKADATPEQAQEAFHKIARTAHPDLHRHGLTAEELEMVTSAYAAVAGAYSELRTRTMQTTRMKPLKPDEIVASSGQTPPAGTPTARAPSPALSPAGPAPRESAQQSMSPKALVYFRKAELALKRGDLKGAILQLKLACATDPASAFLRTALAEVETEVRKGT